MMVVFGFRQVSGRSLGHCAGAKEGAQMAMGRESGRVSRLKAASSCGCDAATLAGLVSVG